MWISDTVYFGISQRYLQPILHTPAYDLFIGLVLLLAMQDPVFVDAQGIMRWRADKYEVALYGANYVITTASDYRAAGYVGTCHSLMGR